MRTSISPPPGMGPTKRGGAFVALSFFIIACQAEGEGAQPGPEGGVAGATAGSPAGPGGGASSSGTGGGGAGSSTGGGTGGVSLGGSAAGAGGGGGLGGGGAAGTAGLGQSEGGAAGSNTAGAPAQGGCSTGRVCDDFESQVVGAAPSGAFAVGKDPNHPAGTVVVDDSQHYSGSKSVKVTTPSGGKSAMLRLAGAPFFPAAGNAFYGRMMYRMAAVPDVNNHSSFIEAGGLVTAAVPYHAVYRYGTQKPVATGSQLLASYETDDGYHGVGPKTDCGQSAQGEALESARWTCIEWLFDGAQRQLRLWMDGKAIDSVSVNGTGKNCVYQAGDFPWTGPTFDHVDVGWVSYQNDTARTAWVDDVVISPTRVGCPAPP